MSELEKVENVTEEQPKKTKKKKSKARTIVEWVLTGIFGALFLFFAVGQIMGMVNKKKYYGETLTYGYGTFVIRSSSMAPEYKVGTAIITHLDSPESIIKEFDKGNAVDMTIYSAYLQNGLTYNYYEYRPDNIDVYYYGRHIVYGEKLEGQEVTQEFHFTLEGHDPVYPTSETGTRVVTHRMIGYYIDGTRALGKGKYTFVLAGINPEGVLASPGQYQLATENELLGVVKVNSNVLGGFFKFITSPWGLLIFLLVPAFYLVVTSVLDIFKAIKEPEEGEVEEEKVKGSSSSIEGLSEKDKERLKKEMLEEMLNKKGGKK